VDTLDLMNHFPVWPTFEKILTVIQFVLGIEFKVYFDLHYYLGFKLHAYLLFTKTFVASLLAPLMNIFEIMGYIPFGG